MSIEKVQGLIQSAAEVSAWWASNKTSFTRKNIAWGAMEFVAMMTGILGAAGTLIAYTVWINGNMAAGREVFLWLFPLATVIGGGGFMWRNKTRLKKFTHTQLRMDRTFNQTVSLSRQRHILSAALNISATDRKNIVMGLQNIKGMDLPKCWWDELNLALEAVAQPVPNPPKSMEERLDEVYVKMDAVVQAHENTSKVLRL